MEYGLFGKEGQDYAHHFASADVPPLKRGGGEEEGGGEDKR